MFAKVATFAVLLPLAVSASPLVERSPGQVKICAGKNFSKFCTTETWPLGTCQELPEEFLNGQLQSIGPHKGALCTFYDKEFKNCTETGIAQIQFPGTKDALPWAEDAFSVMCVECTTCQ